MKQIVLLVFISFLFMITSCSGDEVTGSVSAEISTLTVTVQAENGSLLYNADVYLNGEFKGKTNQYGEGKGTRELVLMSGENVLTVKKSGYVASESISVHSLRGSTQKITVVLEKVNVDYKIFVYDQYGPVSGARVYFSEANSSLPAAIEITNSAGQATFEKVEEGDYSIRVVREEYLPIEVQRSITHWEATTETTIELTSLPRLAVEVVNSQGIPLGNAEVALYRNKDYNAPGAWPLETKFTNSAGIVVFKGVEHGEKYTVTARRQNYLAQDNQLLLTPENENLRFEMVWDID